MKKLVLATIVLIINFSSLFSQTLKGEVKNEPLGFSFIIPDGLEGVLTEQGYVIVSQNPKGFLLISPHYFSSLEEIEINAKEGILDGESTNLALIGNLNKYNQNGVSGNFSGILENQPASAFVISLLSPYSGGISVFVFAERDFFTDEHEELTHKISSTVKFIEPKKSTITDEWQKALNNCRLTYMNSYNSGNNSGGIQDKIIIDLCESGDFKYIDESSVIMDQGDVSGFSSGNKNGAGNWNLIGKGDQAVLRLTFNSGEVYEFVLKYEDEKTYLNGNRFFRTYSDSDVEGTQPECF